MLSAIPVYDESRAAEDGGAKAVAGKDPAARETNGRENGPMRDIIDSGIEAQKQALASQQRIDKTVQETTELALRYRDVLKEIDGLKSYNAQLERQIANQQSELAGLVTSADRVVEMKRHIVPLMVRMTDTLADFIDLDLPFRLAERRAAVARLRALLDNPDAVVSEKFRAVIAAYENESAYGRAFSSYDGQVTLQNKPLAVRFLQVGRVALLFQSRDGKISGLWNPARKSWDILDGAYAAGIAEGIAVARAEMPAEKLLPLPLRVPEKQAQPQPQPERKP